MTSGLTFTLLDGAFAVCRLDSDAPLPMWANGQFFSVTRSTDELSIVCPQANVPTGVKCVTGWRCLKVEGPLDLSLVGILAGIATTLAQANVNIFVVSTYDTDYVLVKEGQMEEAVRALEAAGHTVK